MAKAPTYYDRLGVARNAPDEVIRGAYKALAQKNHPDKNINNPEATTIMQAINQAYDVLSDPLKRADYDAQLNLQDRQAAQARAEERTQRAAAPPPQQQAGGYNAPQQPFPVQNGRAGSVFLILVLIAAICVAMFIYVSNNPASGPRLMPVTAVVPPEQAVRPVAPDTFVPHETTPHELAVCVFAAAKTYDVPSALLLGLLSVEGGEVGEKIPVPGNGQDLGLMKINSSWTPALAKAWEVSKAMALRRVRDDACTNVGIGAWILQTALGRSGDLRDKIAFYRSLAHHTEPAAGDKDYVERVIKLMDLYKSIHSPDDLLGQPVAPAGK